MSILKPSDIIETIERLGCEPAVGPVGEGYEIQQNPQEFAIFWDKINQERKIKTVLELGTGRTGGLAYFMAEFLGVKVTSVDINRPKLRHKNVEFLQGTTEALHPFLRHEVYDLIFIDADHAYSAVKVDHSLYGAQGHIIAFHDVAPNRPCCPGTIEYWAELKGILEGEGIEAHEAIASSRPAGIGWYINDSPQGGKHWTEVYGTRFKDKAAPDITLVSGTYNRLPMLKNMIESARASLPHGIDLDFVIVDGGSTDGTLDYLRAQSDVTLIEHGELKGGARAFTDGANAAKGRYVLMANDDIVFEPDALFKGLCFMEKNLHIGAGAFQFTTPKNPDNWRVNTQMAWIDRKLYSVPYVQVGMIDRHIGNMAGWWGADDPDFNARHYGTDNYLTARILELGFHVDEVRGARHRDLKPNDELKKLNGANQLGQNHPDTQAFMNRFGGEGEAVFNATPTDYTRKGALRIVYCPILADSSQSLRAQKRGWLDSLKKIGLVVEVDYRNYANKHGNQALERYLVGIMEDFKPHILLTQVHAANLFTPDMMRKVRLASPDTVVLNWNGDESSPLYETDEQARAFMKLCDVVGGVNGALFPYAIQYGINLQYIFASFEPVEPKADAPAHDVVYLGNVPRAAYYEQFDPQPDVRPRLAMERALRQNLPGLDIAFYGRGWDQSSGDNLHDWAEQYGLYQNAKISIVDNQYFWAWGYLSNRLFSALAHGQCVFVKPCEGLERLFGFVEGVHYVAWETYDELIEKIEYYLKHDKERLKIGKAGREFAHKYHHHDARTRAILDTFHTIKTANTYNEGVMKLKYTGTSKKPFGGNVGGLKWYFDPSQDDELVVDERIGKRLMQSPDWTLAPTKKTASTSKRKTSNDQDEDTQDDGNNSDNSKLQTA